VLRRRTTRGSTAVAVASAGAFLAVAVTAGAVVATGGPDEPGAPRAVALAQGSLSIADSRDGGAILRAGDVAPGDAVEGTLTIRNTGTIPGVLALSSTAAEVSSGRGGALLDALRLQVTDVSGAGATSVHDGALDDVDVPDLGVLAPGAGRTLRFVARLPEAAGAAGDNGVQGASVQLGYVWRLTADEGTSTEPEPTTTAPPPTPTTPADPPAAPGPDPAPDPAGGGAPDPGTVPTPATPVVPGTAGRRPPPVVRLSSSTVRIDGRGRFGVRVSCARGSSGCRVRVRVRRGKLLLTARTLTLRAGQVVVVRSRTTPEMRRSLRRGHPVLVRVAFAPSGGARAPRTTRVVVRPALPRR
jgi:hypothetical protein